jgi:hypothetical protein
MRQIEAETGSVRRRGWSNVLDDFRNSTVPGGRYLATVRNKKVIDSERVKGHYLPVIPMVLGKGGRNGLRTGAVFRRVLG